MASTNNTKLIKHSTELFATWILNSYADVSQVNIQKLHERLQPDDSKILTIVDQIIVDDNGHIMKYDKPTTAKTISTMILEETDIEKSELYEIYKNTKKLFKTIAESLVQRDAINKVKAEGVIKDMSGEEQVKEETKKGDIKSSNQDDILESVYPTIENELKELIDFENEIKKLKAENNAKFSLNNVIKMKDLESKRVTKLVEINDKLKELGLDEKIVNSLVESLTDSGDMSKGEIREIVAEIPDKVKRQLKKIVTEIDDLNAEIQAYKKFPKHINIIKEIATKQKEIEDLYAKINEIADKYNKPLDDIIKEIRTEYKIKEIKEVEIKEDKIETYEEKEARVKKHEEESMKAIEDFMNL